MTTVQSTVIGAVVWCAAAARTYQVHGRRRFVVGLVFPLMYFGWALDPRSDSRSEPAFAIPAVVAVAVWFILPLSVALSGVLAVAAGAITLLLVLRAGRDQSR